MLRFAALCYAMLRYACEVLWAWLDAARNNRGAVAEHGGLETVHRLFQVVETGLGPHHALVEGGQDKRDRPVAVQLFPGHPALIRKGDKIQGLDHLRVRLTAVPLGHARLLSRAGHPVPLSPDGNQGPQCILQQEGPGGRHRLADLIPRSGGIKMKTGGKLPEGKQLPVLGFRGGLGNDSPLRLVAPRLEWHNSFFISWLCCALLRCAVLGFAVLGYATLCFALQRGLG